MVLSINLSRVEQLLTWLLAYTWGNSGDLFLLSNNYGSISVFTLLALFIYFSILLQYIRRDDQDLAI
jgi:hypothetical protein